MTIEVQDITVAAGDHLVQFYQRDEELVQTVGAYLAEALTGGEAAVVVATEAHRRAFALQLEAAGIDVAQARVSGSFVALDAASTLARIVTPEGLDRGRFNSVIGGVLRQAAGTGPRRPIRAFGEMVALLWRAGQVSEAIELEALWNDLRPAIAFSVLCAYPSHSVAGSEHLDELREVCFLHSAVLPRDCSHRRFGANLDAARAARGFVVETLRSQGHDEHLVADAALVLTELAANALVHARSSFTVVVSSDGDVVSISVHDASSVLPLPRPDEPMRQSGRGLTLVAAVASGWGTELTVDGKVVWAELRR